MELAMIFLSVMVTDFFAEMGDKTQLMLIALSSKYKMRDIVLGTFGAIVVLNAIAVFVGGLLNEILVNCLWILKFVAALAFFYFAVSALLKKNDDDEDGGKSRFSIAPVAVFCTFFVAELGDKTQLAALTFGATYGMKHVLIVLSACIAGFFAADMIGVLVGLFLKKKTPERFLTVLSFVLFLLFGGYTAYEALKLFLAR